MNSINLWKNINTRSSMCRDNHDIGNDRMININLDNISSRALHSKEITSNIKNLSSYKPLKNLTIPLTPDDREKQINPAAGSNPIAACDVNDDGRGIHADSVFNIVIPSQRDAGRVCVPYNHPDAKQYMLSVYKAKPNINPNNIYGPQQGQENCWFNGFFMAFFIGDFPMKFTSYYRKFMILGTDSKGNELSEPLKKAAWGINFLVEYTLRGKIVRPAKTVIDYAFQGGFQQKYGNTGNPLTLFNDLLSRIEYNKVKIADVFFSNKYQTQLSEYNSKNNARDNARDNINDIDVLRKMNIVNTSDIIFVKAANNTPYKKYMKLNNVLYELGSAMFQVFLKNPNDDTDDGGFHLIAGLKINGQYYLYDSNETSEGKTIRHYNWVKRLVEDKQSDRLAFDTTIEPDYIRYYFYYRVR
jgi:hypothetical protein